MASKENSSLQPGMLVYVADTDQVWQNAVVHDVHDRGSCTVTLLHTQEKRVCRVDDVLPRSEQCVRQVHSLTELAPINQASVLACLEARFAASQMYTNAGSTIVAVNPFCDTSHLYTVDMAFMYHRQQQTEPHIYQTGCEAYKRMCRGLGHANQCIIVSGESGSGKTVSAKHLLRYMTLISSCSSDAGGVERVSLVGQSVERRILQSNPILEAFGNAVTQRNDNSSRFGKFITLQFGRGGGHLLGGEIHTYLLEKTRVVHQAPGEANFHIFYQLLASLLQAGDTHVGKIVQDIGEDGFKILPQAKCMRSQRDLKETLEAMDQIGLSQDAQNNLMKVLVAILFLGNVEFTPLEEDIAKLLADKEDEHLDTTFYDLEVTQCGIEQASELLGLEGSDMEQVLLYRSIQSGGNKRRSIFVKPVPQREAYSRRDCLATLLYSRLFDWLVSFINQQIQTDHCDSTIGLLDIYGFEAFTSNSLEQLCINYANEKLQQHYTRHFLKDLQREYDEECIDWQFLSYTDNQPCLDILEGPVSVFGLLNEDVQLNRKEDARQLCERIVGLGSSAPGYVKKPRDYLRVPGFSIHHYAGDVAYTGEGLTNKNKDIVPQELIQLLQHSSSQFVCELFEGFQTDTATGRRRKTVLSKFKMSLDSLLSSLQSSDVHYIRCVKPNPGSRPAHFDRPYVMAQLTASGIIETVKISCHGYPFRMVYGSFLKRYGLLLRCCPAAPPRGEVEASLAGDTESLYDPLEQLYRRQLDMAAAHSPRRSQTPKKRLRRRAGVSNADHTRRCCAALLKLQFGECQQLPRQFGKTKLFLHQHQVDSLECRRLEILGEKAAVVQRVWRGYVARCELRRRREREVAARVVQQAWRSYLHALRHRAVIMLQKAIRMHLARQIFKRLQAAQPQQGKKGKKRSWKVILDRKNVSAESQRSRTSSRSSKRSRSETSFGSDISDASTLSDFSLGKENITDKSSEEAKLSFNLGSPVAQSTAKPAPTLRSRGPKTNELNGKPRKLMIKGRPNLATLFPSCAPSSDDGRCDVGSGGGGGDSCDVSPVKKQRTESGSLTTLEELYMSNGVLTRRRPPKVPIRFHTKPSILKNAHIINKKEFTCGLQDCLPEQKPDSQSETGDVTNQSGGKV